MSLKQQDYLIKALEQAQTRRGFCSPNPAVGAVLVQGERIVGVGCHFACGHPHAEVEALRIAGLAARGATAYVTLEPCRHTGRTPPCTQALIDAGIARVVYAFEDPNPSMAGQSAAILRAAGIACEKLEIPEITAFYASYKHWWQTRRPFVTAKLAISLDGKIADPNGKPVALTGPLLQARTFLGRQQADALLTTVRTIIQDDPRLNVRLSAETMPKPLYVLDTHLDFPSTAQVLKTCNPITLLHGPQADPARVTALTALGLYCRELPLTVMGLLDLGAALDLIGADGWHDLWVEAGGRCFSAFIAAGLVGRGIIYLAPKILGAKALPGFDLLDELPPAKTQAWEIVGEDIVLNLNF